jgi:hypothetical protein
MRSEINPTPAPTPAMPVTQPTAQPTAQPWRTLLRGGALPALALTVPVCAGYALISGAAAAGSVIFGAVLAIIGLAVGPLLLRIGAAWSPTSLMILAVCGYGAVVIVLSVVFALVSHASWLDGGAGAVGLLAAAAAWIAGQTRSTNQLRVLLHGDVDPAESSAPEV